MMFIQNTEGQEVIVTDTQSMWLYKTTNIHEDTDCVININIEMNLRKSMYSLAFGIWYNMFLLHKDTALFNLLTRINFCKHISHQTQIVHSQFHMR